MDINKFPESFFSKAKRNFIRGIVSLKNGKIYFRDLNDTKSKEVEFSKEWEDLNGKPFKLSYLMESNSEDSGIGVRMRSNDDNVYNFFIAKYDNIKKSTAMRVQEKKNISMKFEINGIVVQDGQVVLMSSPVIIYDNWRLFAGECMKVQSANLKQAKIDARNERLERKRLNQSNEKAKNSKNATAWNDNIKSKQKDVYDDAEWIVKKQVYGEEDANKTRARIGFMLLNVSSDNDNDLHFVSLETMKEYCSKFKVKDVRYNSKLGKFIGNGYNNVPIDELEQIVKE